jgi:flavodoxin
MKAAVVYFSLEGNTKHVAEKIGKELDADVIPLIPANPYPTGKSSKFFWGGKSATFKEKPKLQPYQFDANAYDVIILGTPIWAGTFAPPLRTFLRDNKLEEKRVALFACCSGGGTEKGFMQMGNQMPRATVISTLRLVDPLKGENAGIDAEIHAFCDTVRGA